MAKEWKYAMALIPGNIGAKITNDAAGTSYAYRGPDGKITEANNPDIDRMPMASTVKPAVLGYICSRLGNGDRAVEFLKAHVPDIRRALNYSDNAAARRVADAGAAALGVSRATLIKQMNDDLKEMSVGGDQIGHTTISGVAGSGQSTPRDLSALGFKFKTETMPLLQKAGIEPDNKFRPEVWAGQFDYVKPGLINGVRTAMALTPDGAGAVSGSGNLDQRLRAGLREVEKAAEKGSSQLVAMSERPYEGLPYPGLPSGAQRTSAKTPMRA
jgi:hypothetical protein